MVVSGDPRGNGNQLAHYLITMGENTHIHVLEVDGRLHPTDEYLLQTMKNMSFVSELAKGPKGFHHCEISPNPTNGEDRRMSVDDWLQAADILGQELGLENQRRVIVLHDKKNRLHAHVVWERYDHTQGKMISDSFSRLAQDRARIKMEQVFNHTPTPYRNKARPELKTAMTNIWNQTKTGAEFIKAVQDNGYMLAEGVLSHPFRVVDENGRSFDLVKQVTGVRTKEVRQRLRNEKLTPEKQAIEIMRNRKKDNSDSDKSGKQDTDTKHSARQTASAFAENRSEAVNAQPAVNNIPAKKDQSQEKKKAMAGSFAENRPDTTRKEEKELYSEDNDQQKKETIAQQFAENRKMDGELTEEEEIQKLVLEQVAIRKRNKQKGGMRMK